MMFGFCFFVPNNLQAEEYIFNGNLDAANQDLWQLNQDINNKRSEICLLYTSDAADERSSVDLGGRRIIKKK